MASLDVINKSKQDGSKSDQANASTLISLVVCTRNRAAFLPQHLASLNAIQSSLAWEIVFVNNNSTDDTAKLLAEFAQQSTVPVTIVNEQVPGLSNARNAGWQAASSLIIAFTDDDCYPAVNFIDQVHAAFSREDLGFLGGRVLLHDPEDLPWTIKLSEQTQHFLPYSYIGPGNIHGANFAFDKTLLQKLGGFDPLMGSGTPFPCEDCDILLRASMIGFAGRYCPEIVVSHHHRRRDIDKPVIEKAYLAGRAAFFMKSLVDAPKPWSIVYQWLRSAKYFGLIAFVQELIIGYQYLSARRKYRLKNTHVS